MTYFPGDTPTSPGQAPLELNHSHFVMVPGDEWGDESNWIAQVADTVAGDMASVTLLVNGGEIALHSRMFLTACGDTARCWLWPGVVALLTPLLPPSRYPSQSPTGLNH